MKRTLPVLVLAGALTVSACGNADDVGQPAPAGGGDGMGISVTGQGEVMGTPDTLTVNLGVSVLRPNVGDATTAAGDLSAAIIERLTTLGVAEEDIRTSDYSIYPEYDYTNAPRITGYRVSNVLEVKIRDLASAGEIIDAATAAGGDDTVVNGLRFDIEDDAGLVELARAAAWRDAEAKARQLADLAGRDLGPAVTIRETTQSSGPPIYYDRGMAAEEASTPVMPGQQAVTVIVEVTFQFA